MFRLFSLGLELIPPVLILILVFVVLEKVKFRNMRKTGMYFIFAIYLSAMYVIVGLPNILYWRIDFSLYLIPFIGMIDDVKNSILNVILFVPLGFFLPLLWETFGSLKKTVLFGLSTTVAIEILQIFTYRTTDINDIITNVTGTLIGYFVVRLMMNGKLKVVTLYNDEKEVKIVCIAVFAVMFFVQPLLSNWLW